MPPYFQSVKDLALEGDGSMARPIVLTSHLPWCDWVRLAGDAALLFSFGETPDERVNQQVLKVARVLARAAIPGVVSWVPAYTTLLVEFDPAAWHPATLVDALSGYVETSGEIAERGWTWEVPVLYGGSHGPDLSEVAQRLGLSPEEVIAQHSAQPYRIFCLGFAPGFPLAGLLPPSLRLPRRETPRTQVYPGAVAIAGAQTGIYPIRTPGGWHLIGETPVPLFDWSASPPTVYEPGDRLWFRPIAKEAFDALQRARENDGLTLRRVSME